MKNLLLLLAVMVGTLTARADEPTYPYLTFETTEGMVVSVPVSSLTITISSTTLTAGEQTFTLSNLRKMYFSVSDETTDIRRVTATDWEDAIDIYDLNGRKVTRTQVQEGVYIVKSKSGTYKLLVK